VQVGYEVIGRLYEDPDQLSLIPNDRMRMLCRSMVEVREGNVANTLLILLFLGVCHRLCVIKSPAHPVGHHHIYVVNAQCLFDGKVCNYTVKCGVYGCGQPIFYLVYLHLSEQARVRSCPGLLLRILLHLHRLLAGLNPYLL
jgi:hypothetical protein